MLNLITGILGVLVMIAATLAGFYYLGDATEEAQERAVLAGYMNSGAQINAALLVYGVDNGGPPPGTGPAQIAELVSAGYLSQEPLGGWYLKYNNSYTGNTSYRPLDSVAQCKALNVANGNDVTSAAIAADGGCPPCEDDTYKNYAGCIDNTSAVATVSH